MRCPKNIFLTGRPGVGKTTAIGRAVGMLDVELHGFTTREMREAGRRVGFRIDDMQGRGAVMAHVDFSGPVRVGKYRVDVDAVERIAVRALREALRHGTPAVVDEVGRMELACKPFARALVEVVEADIPVLGTMHRRSDPVTRRIREREDTQVIEVTTANRNDVPAQLAEAIRCAMRKE